MLVRATPAPRHALRFDPQRWPGTYVERRGADGFHALLRTELIEHRLWMPAPLRTGDPIACLLPSCGDSVHFAAAATQFLRHLSGQPTRGEVRVRAHDQRAQLSLVALDARRAGASYRAVAERLFGAVRVSAEDWRTSALRDSTIRLVRTGERLACGGHLQLLARKSEL